MLNPEILFSILNALVFFVWLLMIVAPNWKVTQKIISTFAVTLILSIIYGIIIVASFGKINFMDFSSLPGIVNMFHQSNLWGSSAIWYHLLAFDLFVGTWILKDSKKIRMPHLLVIPFLLVTFMLGPLGFLLYQIIKFFFLKFSSKNYQLQ